MKAFINKLMGESRYWWVILLAGILMVCCGFAYWFWPVAGYAVASQIFGWLLILVGIVQLLAASGRNRGKGWGWWLAGGVIDMFIGFLMVRSIVMSEAIFPYFLALIFIFWGISSLCGAVQHNTYRYWWLQLINGILLTLIGFFFIEAGWAQDMAMTSFLVSLAFIYWGFTLAMVSYEMRPSLRS